MTTTAEKVRAAHLRTPNGEQRPPDMETSDMTQQPMAGAVPQWTMSDRLRKAREHAGLDQAQFADEVGISRRSVTNYEKGHSVPSRPVLLAWAMRTGVALDWLTNDGGDGLPRLDSNQRPSDYTSAASVVASLSQHRDRRRTSRTIRRWNPLRHNPFEPERIPA